MTTLGILLACEHYPEVSAEAQYIDAQLRHWLAENGTAFDDIRVFAAYTDDLPRHAECCDAWIVSGTPLPAIFDAENRALCLRQFLRAAASFGRPIYAINHAEHVLHASLAAFDAAPPATPPTPRAIQNPFRSFQSRFCLFRFNPQLRCVEALPRPPALCPRRMFGALRCAA